MGESPYPKFLSLGQPHFIQEMTNTSTSRVKLNIEAILASSCHFSAPSYSNYLFYFYFRGLTKQAMLGFKLQRDASRQTVHST